MAVTIQQRGDTAANWAAANPVLHDREMGIETDTDKVKLGDGAATWASLPYWNPGGDPLGAAASAQAAAEAFATSAAGAESARAEAAEGVNASAVAAEAARAEAAEGVLASAASANATAITAETARAQAAEAAAVPRSATQGGTPLSPAAGYLWQFQPANMTNAAQPFGVWFSNTNVGGVVGPEMLLGYNPVATPNGNFASFLSFLPDCGDTLAQEVELTVHYSDNHVIQPFRCFANLDTTSPHGLQWTFSIGGRTTDYFEVIDDNGSTLLTLLPVTSASGGAMTLGLPTINLEPPAGKNAAFTMFAPAGQQCFIRFYNGTEAWQIQSGYGGSAWALLDTVNNEYPLIIHPGAGQNGQVVFGSVPVVPVAATASAPSWVLGGVYYDTTLGSLRFGGSSSAWVTVATGGGATPLGSQGAYAKVTSSPAVSLTSANTWFAFASAPTITLPDDGNTYRVELSYSYAQSTVAGTHAIGLGTSATAMLQSAAFDIAVVGSAYFPQVVVAQNVIGSGQTISVYGRTTSSSSPTLTVVAAAAGAGLAGPCELACYRVA